jgi:Lon protease-like protein
MVKVWEGGTNLPSIIPLFPLPNAVLFPGVPLPLHVFEPRYREMVRVVALSDDRIIGMVLLRGDWRKDYAGNPDVFRVGCAGRMLSVEPLADGRSNILLQGVREFVITGESHERAYRQATVTWRTPTGGELDPAFRRRIHDLVVRFLGDREPQLARKLLDDASVSDELLVNFLCYALDFSPLEKQALLDVGSLAQRGARLCEVVQFALEGGGVGGRDDRYH